MDIPDVSMEVLQYCDIMTIGRLASVSRMYYLAVKDGIVYQEFGQHSRESKVFNKACRHGHNAALLRIHVFEDACESGHLHVAKWLVSLGTNVRQASIYLFGNVCTRNHLHVAKWLKRIIDATFDLDAFVHVCEHGYLNVAKLLHALKVDTRIRYERAFKAACASGRLEVATWLWTLNIVNIYHEDNYAFKHACIGGHLEVAKWLHNLGAGVGDKEWAFINACKHGHLEVAKWLQSFGIDAHIYKQAIRAANLMKRPKIVKWLNGLNKK